MDNELTVVSGDVITVDDDLTVIFGRDKNS